MSSKTIVKAIPMVSFDLSTIVLFPNFTPINPDGLPEACFMLRIINDSAAVPHLNFSKQEISQDFMHRNLGLNFYARNRSGKNVNFPKGTVVSIKTPPVQGLIHLVGYYTVLNR